MLSVRHLRAAFAVLFAALLMTVTAAAKDGRDFAGFYSLTDVTEQGDQVQVTLNLQIFNYSGADIQQAEITLRQRPPEAALLGGFAPIRLWRSGHDIVLSQQFTVSRQDFEQWGTRNQPDVIVTYHDRDGEEWRWKAQVNRMAEVPN